MSSGIIRFPVSRTRPKGCQCNFKELGYSSLSQRPGISRSSLKGHWCSQCKGIWYGFSGEVECPVCGNRQG
ncbi:MAG TPA: hypothetical protein ENJ32_00690 [Crenotrichaceae bacterium]|nr:hypothetical protein [Crenotrichaceae bacterium]